MSFKAIIRCYAAYAFIGVITFGYAASSPGCEDKFFTSKEECSATKGLLGASFWPLYWTWEGFAIGRQALKGGE